ncbi:MAG: peptidase M15 [Bacteroides sp.]|nr:peptidase M15 [Bacteroides sp.]
MLSEHFSLAEFEKSETARQYGIDNNVPTVYIPTLQQLCRTVLEPLREFAGRPIIITSGYRCPALNIKVGGVYASQHTLGEAADIRLPRTEYTSWKDGQSHTDMETAHRWLTFLKEHTDFDQLILECSSKPSGEPSSLELSRGAAELRRSQTDNGLDYWLHVSCRQKRSKNRHQVLSLRKE